MLRVCMYSTSTWLSNSAGVISAPLYSFPRKVPDALTSMNSCTLTPRTQPNSFERSFSVCFARISCSQNSKQDCKCPGTKSSALRSGAFLGVGSGSSWSNTSLLSSAMGRSRLGLSFFDLTSSGVSFSSYVRTAAVRLALSFVNSAVDACISYAFWVLCEYGRVIMRDVLWVGFSLGLILCICAFLNACDESTPMFAVFGN